MPNTSSMAFARPRMDAAALLSLDAQSQQLEMRAALLDAYAKIPTTRYALPDYSRPLPGSSAP